MFNRPRLFPVGTSYVQIPVTKTATMRELLELVQRGYRYGTWGLVARDKALGLSQKFAELYRANATRGARDYARGKGHAVVRLLMYPDDRTDALLWWLLATSGTGLVHEREALIDTWQARLPWRRVNHHGEWAPQYELEHYQRTRQAGGGRRWTWLMADAYYGELERALVYAAKRKGRMRVGPDETKLLTDNIERLDQFLDSVRKMPGFHGIRQQKRALFHAVRTAWDAHHPPREWPNIGTWVDKHLTVFDGLTLDVLVACLARQHAK
ncbi:MAG: hypothetical protein ACYDDG_07490 [Casimicrobiaceae bacterium]